MRTAEQYLAAIDDGRRVWFEGSFVPSVPKHPVLAGPAQTFASLYDLYADPDYAEVLFQERDGKRVPRLYEIATSSDELVALGEVSALFASLTLGVMSRLPDYGARIVAGLGDRRGDLAALRPAAGATIDALVKRCREGGLALSVAFADPPTTRDLDFDKQDFLRVVRQTPEGIVVNGAKTLCTAAPFVDEIFVFTYPSSLGPLARRPVDQLVGFVVPASHPGLTLLCRPAATGDGFGAGQRATTSAFDEVDACLVFEEAVIPANRVIYCGEHLAATQCFDVVEKWGVHSFAVRLAVKLQALFGLGYLLTDALGVQGIPAAMAALQEVGKRHAVTAKLLRSAEREPTLAGAGSPAVLPDPLTLTLALNYGMEHHADVLRAIELIAGQSLVLVPSDADQSSQVRPLFERYLKSERLSFDDRTRLLRLVGELVGSRFTSRQRLFEDYANGGHRAVAARLGRMLDAGPGVAIIEAVLGDILSSRQSS